MTNVDPTKTEAWKKLEAHYAQIKGIDLKEEFKKDPARDRKSVV